MASPAPCIYVVRCNYDDPSTEEAWNRWYNGPKLEEMLSKPMFLGGQRFRAVGLEQTVSYLAVWHLEGPGAFETQEYKESWGFKEWADHIIDWSRDLYEPADDDEAVSLAVPTGHQLVARAFRVDEVDRSLVPDAVWLRSIGLDRTWPRFASQILEAPNAAEVVPVADRAPAGALVWETAWEPLIEYQPAPG